MQSERIYHSVTDQPLFQTSENEDMVKSDTNNLPWHFTNHQSCCIDAWFWDYRWFKKRDFCFSIKHFIFIINLPEQKQWDILVTAVVRIQFVPELLQSKLEGKLQFSNMYLGTSCLIAWSLYTNVKTRKANIRDIISAMSKSPKPIRKGIIVNVKILSLCFNIMRLICRSSDQAPLSHNRYRVQLKCDGTQWCKVGEVKGKLANGVGRQYSSHYLGTWCIQHYHHYYHWCAHLGCQ